MPGLLPKKQRVHSVRKARTQHEKISLWLTYSTYHNPAEKKKTMSINHTPIISINYTTQHTAGQDMTEFHILPTECMYGVIITIISLCSESTLNLTPFDFLSSTAFLKVTRLCPFVLLIQSSFKMMMSMHHFSKYIERRTWSTRLETISPSDTTSTAGSNMDVLGRK